MHLIVTAEGYPKEASLTPGSTKDTEHLRGFEIDLPKGPVRYPQQVYRKRLETTLGQIEDMLPKSIHAVTARGFEPKDFLFVGAFSISGSG